MVQINSLLIGATDNESVQSVKVNNVEIGPNTTSYNVTANGIYSVVATDNYGNKTTKSITVTNIDKTKPKVILTL